jgi:hypothetical protein
MRSAGFPCRVADCRETWHVEDPTTMTSLLAASAQRTAHEATVHGYSHQPLSEAPRRTYRPRPKRENEGTSPA